MNDNVSESDILGLYPYCCEEQMNDRLCAALLVIARNRAVFFCARVEFVFQMPMSVPES